MILMISVLRLRRYDFMVDQWTGEWTEEKDYSKYPKEKWCDCDYMAAWIREQKYEPETSMKNLRNDFWLLL